MLRNGLLDEQMMTRATMQVDHMTEAAVAGAHKRILETLQILTDVGSQSETEDVGHLWLCCD